MTPRPLDLLPADATIEQAVFTALGAASACWEHLDRAGEFQSDRCKAIGDGLVQWLAEHAANQQVSGGDQS